MDDTIAAPTNIVISTGDFSKIEGTDTFAIANVTVWYDQNYQFVFDGEQLANQV